MKEYKFTFTGKNKTIPTSSIFVANSEAEAIEIAEKYRTSILNNQYDVAELTHTKTLCQ